jgi:CRISPR/Cas system-associated exonuclease Cas4 (RecB family)
LTKSIATLQRDLEHVLNTGDGYTQEIAEWVGNDIAQSLERQLMGVSKQRKGTLRLSNLGTPCERKLWYHVNSKHEPEPLPPSARNKFILGDLTESHVLGLVKASGHTLEGLQDSVDVFGIRGHRDCVIDGMLFDVKSCSSRAFDKFKYGKLREDDTFGYISQLSSYLYGSRNDPIVTEKNKAGFLAVDKQFGHIAVDIYDLTEDLERKEEEVLRKQHVVNEVDVPDKPKWTRIKYDRSKKEYVVAEVAEDWEDGKSGNRKLSQVCSYCEWKKVCWPELRKFIRANSVEYLTKVEREPSGNVFEDKDW